MLEAENDFEITGWRFASKYHGDRPLIGATLEPSHVWDGDEPTDQELRGTSAFSSREACETYAQYSRGTGWLLEIGGTDKGTAGQMVGEILVGDAVVLSVEDW